MMFSAATRPAVQQFAGQRWGAQQAACALRQSVSEPQEQFVAEDFTCSPVPGLSPGPQIPDLARPFAKISSAPTRVASPVPWVVMDGRAILEQMRKEREQPSSVETAKAPEPKAIVGGRPDFGYSQTSPAPGIQITGHWPKPYKPQFLA